MLHGGSAGTNRETRSSAFGAETTVGGLNSVRSGNLPSHRLKGVGGGAKSQAFMKAYYEEKQKRQIHPSPAGGSSRRGLRNRPSLQGTSSAAFLNTNRQ
jgi:hypothetical protein